MASTYTPTAASALEAAYAPRTYTDPIAYTAFDAKIAQAKYFAQETVNELLAYSKGRLSLAQYGRSYTCGSGDAIGTPVRISGNNTVTGALATTAANGKVIGFIFHKGALGAASVGASTTCFILHYYYVSGLSGFTAGNRVFLTDAGAVSATAGTVAIPIGTAISTTEALLHVNPYSVQTAFNDSEGDPVVVDASAAADGTSVYSARRDHKHAFDFTGAYTWSGLQTHSANILADADITRSIGSSTVGFAAVYSQYFNSTGKTAGGDWNGGPLTLTQITTAQEGQTAYLVAANAVAGSSVDGAGSGGSVQLYGGNAARRNTGNGNGGNILLSPGTPIGSGVEGHVQLGNGHLLSGSSGTAVTGTATGFGAAPGVAVAGRTLALIVTVTSDAAAGTSGTVTLTIPTSAGTDSTPVAILMDGSGTWDARASLKVTAASLTSVVLAWDNNGVAPTNGSTYKIVVHIIKKT